MPASGAAVSGKLTPEFIEVFFPPGRVLQTSVRRCLFYSELSRQIAMCMWESCTFQSTSSSDIGSKSSGP